MKKLFLVLLMLASAFSFAQLGKGSNFVGVRATNLGFSNYDKVTTYGAGLQGGHFIQNNLAIVAGVGYTAVSAKNYNANDWNYEAGLKYYVGKVLPIQIDWNGATGNFSNPSKSNLGFSLGYAIFLGKNNNFNIEPGIKYNVSLKDDYKNMFSGGIGANYFFK